jgi:hypothetical protein
LKLLKIVFLNLLIGVGVGMWLGVNIGRDVPLYSNPFDTDSRNQKFKNVTGKTLERGGQALKNIGQALQDQLDK